LNLKFLFDEFDACDRQAFGIAQTMPGLHHLKILNNSLSNVGLLAILDRCSLLESLDLRGCFHLDLSGSIGNRCIRQIRDLWLPTDFIDESDEICDDSYLLSLLLCWPGYDFMRLDLFEEDF
jgi:F-box/leucine-rich repeat protein 2/20